MLYPLYPPEKPFFKFPVFVMIKSIKLNTKNVYEKAATFPLQYHHSSLLLKASLNLTIAEKKIHPETRKETQGAFKPVTTALSCVQFLSSTYNHSLLQGRNPSTEAWSCKTHNHACLQLFQNPARKSACEPQQLTPAKTAEKEEKIRALSLLSLKQNSFSFVTEIITSATFLWCQHPRPLL